MNWIQRRLSRDRGFESEDTVRNNLSILKAQGMILHYEKTDRLDDIGGVDFLVWIKIELNVRLILLQVKTGKFGADKHIKQHGSIIPVVYTKHTKRSVEQQLINIIEMHKRGFIGYEGKGWKHTQKS